MNVWELSQKIEQFFKERRKVLTSKIGANRNWGLLYEWLPKYFDETSVRALAIDFGVMPEAIEQLSFAGATYELVDFIHRSGQWELFRSRLESERSSVPWSDSVHLFSLPLRQEELAHCPNQLQAALLLDHHFSLLEVVNMIGRLDQVNVWRRPPPYLLNRPMLSAVIIFFLAGLQKVPQLLSLMKESRPLVPAIQQFSWEEPDTPFPRKSPADLFRELKAEPSQEAPFSFPMLEELLFQNFSLFDLDELCFEAGISYWGFPGHTVQDRISVIAKFEENISDSPTGKAFIAACASKAPAVNWAEAVGINEETIPPIDSIVTDGFYLSRIRTLLEQCLPDNSHIFDFVQAHFPDIRPSLSINWPPGKNRMELIGGLKRRSGLLEFLNVLEKEYPLQFSLFTPYSK